MPYDSARQRRFMHTKTGREKAPGLAERYDQEIRDARKRKGRTVSKSARYGNSGGVGRRITEDQLVEKALAPTLERKLSVILGRSARSGSLGSGIPNRGVTSASAPTGIGRHRSARTDATPAYMARLRRNARQGKIGQGEYVGRRRKVTKGLLHQSVARPIARRAATATLANRGITQGRLVATGGAGARKGNLGVAKGARWTNGRPRQLTKLSLRKKPVGKARYFDPDERRERRQGMAIGALGLAGGAAVLRGGRSSVKTTRKLREVGRAAVRNNKNATTVARGRQMQALVSATPRELAYLGGGTAGLASAAELHRRGTTRRGGRWT